MEQDPTNFRMERISKLLHELRYEIERGMVENEIDEHLHYQFFVPISRTFKNGVVMCRFETRPIMRHQMPWNDGEFEPRLRVVK
jgi:hypothetical protein